MTEDPRECAYYRGIGKCTQMWRGCGLMGEPRCITEEPMAGWSANGSNVAKILEFGPYHAQGGEDSTAIREVDKKGTASR